MMDLSSLYKSKLTTPAEAVGRIASGVKLSMGMAMSEPPAAAHGCWRTIHSGQSG